MTANRDRDRNVCDPVGIRSFDTFQMLTEPEKTGQMRDLGAAQSQISQVDMFQDFLNKYRQSSQPEITGNKP